MLDSNAYELILKEIGLENLRKAKTNQEIIFYGADVIRKELRQISKQRKSLLDSKIIKLRNVLLSIYDLLVEDHQYIVDMKTDGIAQDYYVAYSVLGGKTPKDDIITDFRIVACASLHNIDILVSDDRKTMFSKTSLNAYASVNSLYKIRNPAFIKFDGFKELIGGVNLD